MAGVLVIGEMNGDALQSITGELLAAGRGIADVTGENVGVALLNGGDTAGQEAISLGADHAYLVQDEVLAEMQLDAQVAALEKVCAEVQPSVVLIGRTLAGRDVGPRLAFRLGVGLAQDCLQVEADANSGRVVAVRPVYGGNALAKVTFPDANPQMVVMRAKAYEPLDADDSRVWRSFGNQPRSRRVGGQSTTRGDGFAGGRRRAPGRREYRSGWRKRSWRA